MFENSEREVVYFDNSWRVRVHCLKECEIWLNGERQGVTA